jgi:hypothetical protein
MLSAAPASAAEPPVTYVIDTDGIRSQFSTGLYEGYVVIGNTSQIIMEDPLLVIGSGIDSYELNGIERTLKYNYFRPQYILNDSVREFMGRDLTDYNLILIGGPEHNAYTKYLIDTGYLTKTYGRRMPAVIMESGDPGSKCWSSGTRPATSTRRDLPLNGIIPENTRRSQLSPPVWASVSWASSWARYGV